MRFQFVVRVRTGTLDLSPVLTYGVDSSIGMA